MHIYFQSFLMPKFNYFRVVIPQRDRMRYCFDIQICFLTVKKIDNCKNVSFEYDMSITESPTWDKFVLKVNNFIFLILYNKYILFTDNENIVIHPSQITMQIYESSTTIKQHNDFHKKN